VLFALYIVLADRVAKAPGVRGIDGLAGAMLVAAVVVTPLAGWAAAPAALDPVGLAAGVGVGVCSSVVPYVADQLALARLPRATYALMVALLPATATVIGVVVLAQLPTAAEVAGVALVVAGVALHRPGAPDRGYPGRAHPPRHDSATAPASAPHPPRHDSATAPASAPTRPRAAAASSAARSPEETAPSM
jgi:inner membrane transporter RhtA